MNIEQTEQEFLNLLKEQNAYQEATMLTHWDMRTKIPKNGVEQRSEVVGFLSEKQHEIETSDQMKYFIDELKENTKNPIIRKAVEESEKNYERNRKIPTAEFKEYVMLQSKSEAIWQQSREKDDFSLFQPYLEKLVEYNKRFAEYWGYAENKYDALLHNFEPGVTTATLNRVFPTLRKSLTEMLKKINESNSKPDASLLSSHFPEKDQEDFTIKVLEEMGYNFFSGRLDKTIHPFAIALNMNDVRITTRYDNNDFRMAVFGTIHEGGHALYEQNINQQLAGTPLATGTSMGIHESQSLFWENFISRSKPFWEKYYALFQSYAPNNFQNIPLDDFYHSINEVKPSLNRIEADELTYPLHIMIRYELENALINDEISVSDLPGLWNEKMNEYLGVTPPTNREGVLQDIHWAGGDFGYFPSYALGYMYAAQFHNTMKKEMDIDALVRGGKFDTIRNWLTENIHQYGKMKKPLEIIEDVTKEKLNPDYLLNYLNDKYAAIYKY